MRVLVVLVEGHDGGDGLEQLDSAGSAIDDAPLDGHLEHLAEHVDDVVDGLRAVLPEARLQLRHVLVGDAVELFRAERGHQMQMQNPLLGVDRARLLAVGQRVALDEPLLELLEGRDLLSFGFGLPSLLGRGLKE
jgi:hypothetical protein